MLTSTQSVMDRLAHFYHWKDYQALEQAVWITEDHMDEVDFREKKSGLHWTDFLRNIINSLRD